MAAADIRDLGAALELVDDAVERRQPLLHQLVLVGGAEEARGAAEQAFGAVVPADALAGPERFRDFRLVQHEGRHHVADRAHEIGAVLVGEHHRLLGEHRKLAGDRLVLNVAAGCLRRQPLAHAAFGGAARSRKLLRGHRALGREHLVKAEAVANLDQRRVGGGAEISQHLAHE